MEAQLRACRQHADQYVGTHKPSRDASAWALVICAKLAEEHCAVLFAGLVHGTPWLPQNDRQPTGAAEEAGDSTGNKGKETEGTGCDGEKILLEPRSTPDAVSDALGELPEAERLLEETCAVLRLQQGDATGQTFDTYLQRLSRVSVLRMTAKIPSELWLSSVLVDALRHVILQKLHGKAVEPKQHPSGKGPVDCHVWYFWLWGFLEGGPGIRDARGRIAGVVESYVSTPWPAPLGNLRLLPSGACEITPEEDVTVDETCVCVVGVGVCV